MENQPIDVGIAPEEQYLPIDPETLTGAPVSPEVADIRASKAAFGVGAKLNLPKEYFYNAIVDGSEDNVRGEIANMLTANDMNEAQKNIVKIAGKKNLSLGDIGLINQLSKTQPRDPSNVFEEEYGKSYMDALDKADFNMEDTLVAKANLDQAINTSAIKAANSEFVAKREIAQRRLEQAEEVLKQQSYVGYAADIAKGFIPFYNELKQRGWVDNYGLGSLLGEAKESEGTNLYMLPTKQFQEKLNSIMDSLQADNPALAVSFGRALVGTSNFEKSLDNLSSILEVVGAKQIGGALAVKGSVALYKQFTRAAKDVAVSAADANLSKATLPKAAGDLGEAAVQTATERALDPTKGKDTPRSLTDNLLSVMRADNEREVASIRNSRFGEEGALRIENQGSSFSTNLGDLVENIQKVDLLPWSNAVEKANRYLKAHVADMYPSLAGRVLDYKLEYDAVTNSYKSVIQIGREGAELFTRPYTAIRHAKWHGLDPDSYTLLRGEGPSVHGQGVGWYIETRKPLDLTSDVVRNGTRDLTNVTDPSGYIQNYTSWVRSADDVQTAANTSNRKTATYAPSVIEQFFKNESDYIKNVSKGAIRTDDEGRVLERNFRLPKIPGTDIRIGGANQWDDWELVVQTARKLPDAEGQMGRFYDDLTELDAAYMDAVKRLPNLVETEAYFSYKRMVEADRVFRNLAVLNKKLNWGAESHTISVLDETGKSKVALPSFDGKVLNHVPGSEDLVMVVGKTIDDLYFIRASSIAGAQDNKIDRLLFSWQQDVKNGRKKMMEVYEPRERPFSQVPTVGSQYIRYVLSDSMESKPIKWEQVPRRGGGHWEYDDVYEHYVKQPIISAERIGRGVNASTRYLYEGDSTFVPVNIRAKGEDISKHMNAAKNLLKEGKKEAAQAYVEKNLPMEWKTFQSWFKPTKVNGETVPARFNMNEDFRVVPKNSSSLPDELRTKYGDQLRDLTRKGSAAAQDQIAYTRQRDSRDLMTINNYGTPSNPVWKYEEAKMLNVLPTQNRALSRIINSTFMDDYKKMAVEEWLVKAQKYLIPDEGEVRGSPLYNFYHPAYRNDVDFKFKSGLEAQRWQIKQFLGEQTPVDKALHSITQQLADLSYGWKGEKAALVPLNLIPLVKDPASAMRSMAYHFKMGLFAIPQLAVQLNGVVTSSTIAGLEHAIPANSAALLHAWTRHNMSPAFIKALDDKISRMSVPGVTRYKPGEFTESVKLFNKTGFGNVGGEHALRDDIAGTKMFKSGLGEFLDLGDSFFKMGERGIRYSSWHLSYLEFRAANPIKQIGRQELAQIRDRADLLSINMSRASNSSLHTSFLSLPTQFLTYQLRMFELFMSNRLTSAEKMRMVATQAAFYGVPMATGLYGIPAAESLRKNALENGYVPGDKLGESLIMEGIPAVLLAIATGEGTLKPKIVKSKNTGYDLEIERLQTGNKYNVGTRYGTGGLSWLSEAVKSDKNWFSLLGGASGSILINTLANTSGFYNWLKGALTGKSDDPKYELTSHDLYRAGKEITSVFGGHRFAVAAGTGKWISKREADLVDVSTANAAFMTMMGLSPTEQSDMFLKTESMKKYDERVKDVTKMVSEQMRLSIQASRQNNPDEAHRFRVNALALMAASDINSKDRGRIMGRAFEDNGNLVEQADFDFYIKKAPDNMKKELIDAYSRARQQKVR